MLSVPNLDSLGKLIHELMPMLIPLAIIELGLMVGALVHLLKRGKAKYLKIWIWILIIVLIHIIGPVLYFIIGREDA